MVNNYNLLERGNEMIHRIEVVYDIDENDCDHLDINLETEYTDYEAAIKCYTLLLNAHQNIPDVYVCMTSYQEGNPPNVEEEKEKPKYLH